MKILVGVYTNQVKSYCDERFFSALIDSIKEQDLIVVDNTKDNEYFDKLSQMLNGRGNTKIIHKDVPYLPSETRFHRNVLDSVREIRNHFLADKSYDAFLIVESDVIVKNDTVDRLIKIAKNFNTKGENWGGIGALYYQGFHDYNKTGIQQTHHVLSGCTLYNRSLIEKINFRVNFEDLGLFPDALISYDATCYDPPFTLWDDHDIRLEHAHNPETGTRYIK